MFNRRNDESHVFFDDTITENSKSVNINRKGGPRDSQVKGLFKFIPYKYFISAVEQKELLFSSPLCWDDPYDYMFYANPQMNIVSNPRLEVSCFCTSCQHVKDEEAMWRFYGMDYIRIEYNLKTLIKTLEHFAIINHKKGNDIFFYIVPIDYSMGKEQLKKKYKEKKNQYSSLEECLECLSLKRTAYEYEREVRIFAIGNKLYNEKNKKHFKISNVEYDNNLIGSIYLPPLPAIKYDDIKYNYYDNIQTMQNAAIKEKLKVFFNKRKIHQSRLYSK